MELWKPKLVLGWMLNLWGDLTQNLSNHNPKGKIQEWVQVHLPSARIKYRIIGESGPDHARHFESEILINNKSFGKGEGNSKKEAESKAQVAIALLCDKGRGAKKS